MQDLRNIALIAHVDHGKTTLVDQLLYTAQLFQAHQEKKALIMDNNDLERERGITILSKHVAIRYRDPQSEVETKINIIDTPGHADFGGEVERVLRIADGVLLLVDAFEGPMPQTRTLLKKALELGLKPLVVINKIDKTNARPEEVQEAVFELMFELGATDEQLDFTTLYGSARDGWMSTHWEEPREDIIPLLKAILREIPPPVKRVGKPRFQISSLDYSSFKGRIAVGRLYQGTLEEGAIMGLSKADGSIEKVKIKELHTFEGLGKKRVASVCAGELCTVSGLDGFEIGDTLTDLAAPEPLDRIAIDPPTMSMLFTINTSPFAGEEGSLVTLTHLRNRLYQEAERNLALRVEKAGREDAFMVYGRGILHLSILIETMRREGHELQVGQAQMLFKEMDGKRCEPIEELIVEVPEAFAGKVIELAAQRKGNLLEMEPKGGLQRLCFEIPARGLIGLRNTLLTVTTGEAVMHHRLQGYAPYKGDLPGRSHGSLVSLETGVGTAYAMHKLKDRGIFFIKPGERIYTGQIIGEHTRSNDLPVNVVKGKKLTNMRAAGSDEAAKLPTPRTFSLEDVLEYLQAGEYAEIAPKTIRLRKINPKVG